MSEGCLQNADETERYGRQLFHTLPNKVLVFLHGELGMGKTTLVRGLLREAGFTGTVKSPTYNLVEEYVLPTVHICHFDLYRLKDPEELEWLGMDDYLNSEAICLIEWPEMGAGYLPKADIECFLESNGAGRKVSLHTHLTG